jgi:hypothetical protein
VIDNEQARWLRFFKEGKQLNDLNLPDWMNTQEMKQAMNTLCQFSEKERNYFAYQARQDFLRQQGTILFEKDEALVQRDEALEREQIALAERDAVSAERDANAAERDAVALRAQEIALREQQALAEIEKLKALLDEKKS